MFPSTINLSFTVGLTLDDARDAWRERGVGDEAIEIIECAPPVRPPLVRPPRRENVPQKRKTKASTKAQKPAPRFGELRVLRVVYDDDFFEFGGKIKVTVAREELKPDETEIAAPLGSSIEL